MHKRNPHDLRTYSRIDLLSRGSCCPCVNRHQLLKLLLAFCYISKEQVHAFQQTPEWLIAVCCGSSKTAQQHQGVQSNGAGQLMNYAQWQKYAPDSSVRRAGNRELLGTGLVAERDRQEHRTCWRACRAQHMLTTASTMGYHFSSVHHHVPA
jgi:hypothetical protein